MLKYLLMLIGAIAVTAFLLGRARPNASVAPPREWPIYTKKSQAESRAATSAVSQNPSGANKKIRSLPIIKKESVTPITILPKIISQSPALSAVAPPPSAATSSVLSAPAPLPKTPTARVLPPLLPLDEKSIFRAVVKIECPDENRTGKYTGAGFAMPHGIIVTAAHLIKDSGADTCQIIFPRDRAPSIYLFARTEDRETVRKRHDEQGIDAAFLFMPLLANYPEARAVFPDAYPFIPYPICADPAILGDAISHFGYPGNFQDNSYLAQSDGTATTYADIKGIREELSADQTYLFKTPVFGYTDDQTQMHPYLVARSPSYYGDSGGMAFDMTRQCIIGPDRGGTNGGAAGENFSLFTVLGWDGTRAILP